MRVLVSNSQNRSLAFCFSAGRTKCCLFLYMKINKTNSNLLFRISAEMTTLEISRHCYSYAFKLNLSTNCVTQAVVRNLEAVLS